MRTPIITRELSNLLVRIMDAMDSIRQGNQESATAFHCGYAISKVMAPFLINNESQAAFVDAVSTYFKVEVDDGMNKDPPVHHDERIELPF